MAWYVLLIEPGRLEALSPQHPVSHLLTLFGVIHGSRSPHSSNRGSLDPRICLSSWLTDTLGALLLLMR